MGTRKQRTLLALAVAVAGGTLVGTVVAQRGDPGPADIGAMQAAIERAKLTRVADIAPQDGQPARGVFVQELNTGHLCIWDVVSAASNAPQGGCNSIDDPLGDSGVSANLAYDGGPSIETVSDARLSGLASTEAEVVAVLMNDGSERRVRLRRASLRVGDFVAFGYRFKRSDLRDGIGPVAVIARDADGDEIGRQSTGIG